MKINPTGVTASDGVPGRVSVSWNPVEGAGAYGVYRTENPSFPPVLLGFISQSPFIDRTGGPGTQYHYYVTAAITIHGAGESDVAKANSDVGHSVFQSARPLDVIATSNLNAAVLVEWPPVAGANFFRVWRSSSEEGAKTALSGWVSVHSWLDTTTTMGQDHYYWIQSSTDSTGADASEFSDFAIGREGEPVLWIDPMEHSIAFRRLGIGETESKPITVFNVGYGALTIHEVSGLASPFTSIPANLSGSTDDWIIEPGDSLTFWVIYFPEAAGSHTGTLTLASNDPDSPDYAISLAGSANAPPTISALLANPPFVTRPDDLILMAQGVNDDDGNVMQVAFYRDSNGNGSWDAGDTVLGFGIIENDVWMWTGSTADWMLGQHTLFVRAQDDDGAWSAPTSVHATVVVTSWHNPDNAFDIDADGNVTPSDVLLLINEINRNGAGRLPVRTVEHQHLPYYDVNGDGFLTPMDVLMVISHINLNSSPTDGTGGEGESMTEWVDGSQTPAAPMTSSIAERPQMFRGRNFDEPRRGSGPDTLVQPAFDLSRWLDAEREELDFESILDERMADDDDLDIFFGRLGLQKEATWEALCQQLDVRASGP